MNPGSCPCLRLTRATRLRDAREFVRARQAGCRLVKGCLIVNWLGGARSTGPRLGVVVGRKVGSAVARSRARRLLREAFRRHQHDLREPATVVLIARPSIAGKTQAEVDRDYLEALRQRGLLSINP